MPRPLGRLARQIGRQSGLPGAHRGNAGQIGRPLADSCIPWTNRPASRRICHGISKTYAKTTLGLLPLCITALGPPPCSRRRKCR